MPVLTRLLFSLYQHILELKAWFIATILISFLMISWLLFKLSGETEITRDLFTFIYFATTTASTVGYGDMSPTTTAGRLVAAFWFLPGSLLIFSAALGRFAGSLVEGVRRMADGQGNFHKIEGATVIVGHQKERTQLIIDNLIAGKDGDDRIILLAPQSADIAIDQVRLVKAERLDALSSLKRAGIEQAAKVIVYDATDAQTFNICLAVRELNEHVHIAAYFDDRDTARRAGKLAMIEPVISNSCEALVRAAQDPGASKILMALSSSQFGSTIFSASISGEQPITISDLEQAITNADGTLIALSQPDEEQILFRPYPDSLKSGGIVYYLAKNRLQERELLSNLGDNDVRIMV